MRKCQNGFGHHLVLLIIVFIGIALAGLGVYRANNKQDVNAGNLFINKEVTSKLSACQGNAYFYSSVIPVEKSARITPLGQVNPGQGQNIPSDHVIIEASPHSSVLSPGKVHYIGAAEKTYYKNGQLQRTDWAVAYAPCRQILAYNGHIANLSDGLKAAVAGGKKWCNPVDKTLGDQVLKTCTYHFDYAALGGEQIGQTGADSANSMVDWGLVDLRVHRLAFVNQSMSKTLDTTADIYHDVCPTDYYVEGSANDFIQSQLPNRPAPRCGEVMQDKSGTVQGNWQLNSTKVGQSQSIKQMSIIHDKDNPNIGVIVIGGGAVKTTSGFNFYPSHSGLINREPSEVKADGRVYCYQGDAPNAYQGAEITGKVLMQLTDQSHIKVENLTGNCLGGEPLNRPFLYSR